jgi:8-oxo-dGTP pyrophosphatase MutT (NUDIX family)
MAFVPAHPSATVVLLRDGAGGLEVLLARRQTRLAFHGGAWVFPGGRVDPADYTDGDAGDELDAARRAALREAAEEVGLTVAGPLVPFAHWTTPDEAPKRFATWFFAARAASGPARGDGTEIVDVRWTTVAAALDAHARGALELPPPTYVTLCLLAAHATVDGALADLAAATPQRYRPRPQRLPGGTVSVYQEDAAYADGALDRPGPRHRLWMLATGWRYERYSLAR